MGEVIRRRERKELGGSTMKEIDPLGNVMVESTQQLRGKKKVKRKRKPKAPITEPGQSRAEETEDRGRETTQDEDTKGK